MGKPTQKWKTRFFGKKIPAKNVVFWFWPKIQKLRPLYYTKKIWKFRIWSQIFNTWTNRAVRTAKWISGFLAIIKKWENQPKIAQECQNDKTQAKPLAVSTHWESGRNSYLELPPVVKKAIFGQKEPKKCRFVVCMAPSGKVLWIWLQILNFQNFLL